MGGQGRRAHCFFEGDQGLGGRWWNPRRLGERWVFGVVDDDGDDVFVAQHPIGVVLQYPLIVRAETMDAGDR